MNKIKLYPYTEDFVNFFKKEKSLLAKSLLKTEIHHIGSTAIPGTHGKGIIDILIAIDWKNKENVVQELKSLGYKHIHPEDDKRIFLSKIGPTRYGNAHIHLTELESKEYENKLKFRDKLRNDQDLVLEYNKLKENLVKHTKGDREEYTKLKKEFIKRVINRSK